MSEQPRRRAQFDAALITLGLLFGFGALMQHNEAKDDADRANDFRGRFEKPVEPDYSSSYLIGGAGAVLFLAGVIVAVQSSD